jgi:hypothetical protein
MSGRITAVFGAIVLMAVAGVDYGAEANRRPETRPLGVAEHVMIRVAQAKEAMGFAPAPAAAPVGTVGKGMAQFAALLDQMKGKPETGADLPPDLAAAVAAGDPEAMAAMVQAEFARVAAELDGASAGAAAASGPAARPGKITLGVGTCAKRGAGKFCSVGGD